MNREIRSVWVPIEEPMARETRMACIEPGMAGPFRLVAEALAEGMEPYAVTSAPGVRTARGVPLSAFHTRAVPSLLPLTSHLPSPA